MKKGILIFFALVCIATATFAQPMERTNAFNYLNKGVLDKAKKSIDAAVLHEKTMNDARTWFYKGNVYLAIRLTDQAQYKTLDPNPLQVSYEAYEKAIKLDEKKEYFEDIMQRMMIIGEQFYNVAVEAYTKKNYKDAVTAFETTVNINKNLGRMDTLAMYNTAFVSELAGDNMKAKQYYQNLMKINFKQPLLYSALANIYKSEKDTVMAIEIIKRGRLIYPDDFNLLISETNIYLSKNDIANAQKNLNQAVAKDPSNPTIHFAVGTTWDQMGNVPEAEKAYLKAIELKPEYFDAIYNLGALYFNQGVKMFETADKETDMDKYAKLKAEFDESWKKAMPMLEKAHQLDPKDANTMISLKQLYARLSLPEKLKGISEEMSKAGLK
jgi:tetratricopeptide (TPR) repeat protein